MNPAIIILGNLEELPVDSRIYIKALENKVFGYLIISDDDHSIAKIKIHEFYIYEPYQRFGHGKVS